MKTKMNSSSRALITTLIVIIVVAIVVCVTSSIFAPVTDYTNDYLIYNEISGITSTYELMDYCHRNNINYSINDGCFVMEGYRITFSLNKAECAVDNNKHMNCFYLLENGRADKTFLRDDLKVFQIKTWGANYELSNGHYTLYNMWPALISFAVAILLGLILTNYLFYCQKCKRCNQ